jgi:general secretion pathway protein A
VPEDTLIALILNPLVTPQELLSAICDELGVDISQADGSSKKIVDALNAYLLQQYADGKRVVVVIDEAQNLSPEALEQVRLLTNLETAKHKLLQMVLLGQPELRQLLQQQNLRQLAQRITARYHLAPLNEQETIAYVKHRMRVAGARQSHFNNGAMKALFRRSGGVPRLINIIADRALAGAYALERDQVNAALVHAAADEVHPAESQVTGRNILPWAVAALLVAGVGGLALSWQQGWLPGSAGNEPVETSSVASTHPHFAADGNRQALPGQETTKVMPDQIPPAAAQATPAGAINRGENQAQPVGSLSLRDPAWDFDRLAIESSLTDTWLADQHLLAYPGLAQLWQAPDQAKGLLLACEGVPATGFACLKESGNWAKVRKLGLPVILVLRSDGDKHVLLRGMDGQRILLGAGSVPRYFQQQQVDELWMGEYIVAWPQSPDWPDQIRRDDQSAAVDIVLSMAAQADPPWLGKAVFNQQFETWLKTFQRNHGLLDDGIVGPQTLLYLMAPTIVEPRLQLAETMGS